MPPHGAPVIAGVDVGNATTEVAVLAGNQLLGVDRLPTRGGKGSAESLRGAAALVRRLERRYGAAMVRRHYEELLPHRLESRG